MGKKWKQWQIFSSWDPNHCGQWLQPWNLKKLAPWRESYDKHRQHVTKQRHHFSHKSADSQSYSFSNSQIQMWALDHKEGWALKNWWFWTVILKTLESHLDCKEIKPVSPKGNQPWIFIGRTDAEVEAPVFSTRCEELIHWKRPWFWKRLRAGGEEGDRGWDVWMTSQTQWTWIWENSRRYWRTEKPAVLQSLRLQRVGHDLVTEQKCF